MDGFREGLELEKYLSVPHWDQRGQVWGTGPDEDIGVRADTALCFGKKMASISQDE